MTFRAIPLALALMVPLLAHGQPLRFKLDHPFQQQVELDATTSVRLTFQGSESLQLNYAGKTQVLPVEEAGGEVMVEDFDFDGRKDIAIPSGIGYGGVNVFYQVYRLRESFQPFPEEHAICNPEFSAADRTLITNSRSGPLWYGVDYRFHQGQPWVWRRRLPVLLDAISADCDLLTLFEVYDRQGKVVSARLSQDPAIPKPVTLKLSQSVALFPSPGSRGTRGLLKVGTVISLGAVTTWSERAYAQVSSSGWILLPKGCIHR